MRVRELQSSQQLKEERGELPPHETSVHSFVALHITSWEQLCGGCSTRDMQSVNNLCIKTTKENQILVWLTFTCYVTTELSGRGRGRARARSTASPPGSSGILSRMMMMMTTMLAWLKRRNLNTCFFNLEKKNQWGFVSLCRMCAQ